jgi:hypothetical protein
MPWGAGGKKDADYEGQLFHTTKLTFFERRDKCFVPKNGFLCLK